MAEKFVCRDDSCDQPHCKRCGHHYDPACSEQPGVCDACTINAAASGAEVVTRAFGGNYEEAARFLGW